MIRIVFVDDYVLVLEAMRRTMRSKRAEWSMEFFPSGAVALNTSQSTQLAAVLAALNGRMSKVVAFRNVCVKCSTVATQRRSQQPGIG